MKTKFVFVCLASLVAAVQGETLNLNCDWQFRRDCDETWQRVSVPHCVNVHDTFDGHAGAWGEKDQWRGTMFYRKRFALASLPAKAFLEIEAIRQTARVRVNGKDCGFYDAGIAACGFDLTDAIKEGENEIVVWDFGGTDWEKVGAPHGLDHAILDELHPELDFTVGAKVDAETEGQKAGAME